MTGLNASRVGGQIDATTLGAGTVKGASLLTSGNSSTVTLRRESCQPLAIGHNKPLIKKPEVPGFITRLQTAVLAQTADNDTIQTNGNYVNTTYSAQLTLFGFNDAVLTTPNGSASTQVQGPYPWTFTVTNAPTTVGIGLEVFGDPADGVLDFVYAFNTYSATKSSANDPIMVNSGQLIMGHWEVNRNGSVNYNQYTSNSAAPTRLQGIYNFSNPAGLPLNQWNKTPSTSAQPYITTRRTTLVLSGLLGLGIKLDGKKGIMVNKNKIPTSYIMTPISNRIRAHMNRSHDNIIRGTLPIALDDPSILYSGNIRVICSSSQGRKL